MIELRKVTKTFLKNGQSVAAVNELSWQAEPGTFSVIYGKSGSGKSTLLMMIGGMMSPTGGKCIVGGRDLYAISRFRRNAFRRKSVGFIFQRFLLLPYFTVYENIALPLAMKQGGEVRDKVHQIAHELDLTDRIHHYPAELSVGQQQRVAMARALVKDPDIVIADEPTGNLDAENAEIVVKKLFDAAEAGKTVIAATHDSRLLEIAQHKLCLVNGRIAAAG